MFSKQLTRCLCCQIKTFQPRNISSASAQGHHDSRGQPPLEDARQLAYEEAKPLSSMPGPSFWKFFWEIRKDPSLKLKIDQVCKDWFDQYGPSFILNVPGLASRVNIMDPESVQGRQVSDRDGLRLLGVLQEQHQKGPVP